MHDHTTHILREITPLSDSDCFYIVERYKSEFTYPLHNHLEFELNYIESGTGLQRIVGDSVETIGAYDLVLITGKELEHTWRQAECKSPRIREITIQFSQDLLSKSFIDKNQFASIRLMLEKAQNGLVFPMPAIMKVYSLIDSMVSETQGFYTFLKFLSILYELSITNDYRTLSSSSFAKADITYDSRRVQKVQNYLKEHYMDDIALEDLSLLVGMTPSAFSRFFKLRTGKNPTEYISEIRLGYAARMLADSTKSVAEICYDCGFNNLSHFNRIFKRDKGCTPTDFRENFRKKKILI